MQATKFTSFLPKNNLITPNLSYLLAGKKKDM